MPFTGLDVSEPEPSRRRRHLASMQLQASSLVISRTQFKVVVFVSTPADKLSSTRYRSKSPGKVLLGSKLHNNIPLLTARSHLVT